MSERFGAPRRYQVMHQSVYRYSEPVTLSHQQLHLAPRPLDYQVSGGYQVTISPAPTDAATALTPSVIRSPKSPSRPRTAS